jgi:hypothetical protein
MARGMNLMVLNNNGMADMLALMVLVRSMTNTALIMRYLNLALALTGYGAGYFLPAAGRWFVAWQFWDPIDRFFNDENSGFGWLVMKQLDTFNLIVKASFPFWAIYQAAAYARKNLANQFPFGFVLPGASGAPSANIGGFNLQPPLPTFPVARGPEQTIADRVDQCQFGPFHAFAGALFFFWVFDPLQVGVAMGIYYLVADANINFLRGTTDQSIVARIARAIAGLFDPLFDKILEFLGPVGDLLGDILGWIMDFVVDYVFDVLGRLLGIELLDWPSDEARVPKPMLLTEDPTKDTTDERNAEASDKLRSYLEYLGIALGKVPTGSPIGGERFYNKPNRFFQVQFTYGQANVYNPYKWDMWTQDWRAQLVRAKLFDSKVNSMFSILSNLVDGSSSPTDDPLGINWSFVNAH